MAAPIPPELLVCVCGTRGCEDLAEHVQAYIKVPQRRHRGGSKKPRHGRR